MEIYWLSFSMGDTSEIYLICAPHLNRNVLSLSLFPSEHNHLNNAALPPLGPAMALSHPHNNLGIGFNKYTSLKAVGE